MTVSYSVVSQCQAEESNEPTGLGPDGTHDHSGPIRVRPELSVQGATAAIAAARVERVMFARTVFIVRALGCAHAKVVQRAFVAFVERKRLGAVAKVIDARR